MKELTIEQKARAYDEALEKAKDFYKGYKQRDNQLYANDLETIFPELCESEDEKIRKEIIKFLELPHRQFVGERCQEEWIAWLEKQKEPELSEDLGEYVTELNKQFPEVSFAKLSRIAVRVKNWLEKQGEFTDTVKPKFKVKYAGNEYNVLEIKDIAGVTFYGIEDEPNHIDYVQAKNCEIIGGYGIKENDYSYPTKPAVFSEQKTTDKVVPKFKVGNWYQCTKDFFGKGVTFDKNTAYYCAQEGCLQCEYGCHIAIIKDLYDNFKLWDISDAKDGDVLSNGEMIVIFKHFEEPSYRQHIVAYIGLDINGNIQITDDTWNLGIDKVKPATKEQRDTLLKVMADAGYTFDFGKKELKKIEKKPQRMVSAEVKEALYDKPTDEEMKELLRTEYEKGRADTIAEMKSSWSEEDETNLNSCISKLEIDMQHWEGHGKTMVDGDRKLISWLKSLRPQNTWKPSDEQIKALKEACDEHWESDGLDPLYTLWEQLKKLREE